MNNYERTWFHRWFPTVARLKALRKKFTKSSSSYETGANGTELFNYNYPPNSPYVKDTQFIRVSKHKIDQAIEEYEKEDYDDRRKTSTLER